MWRPEQLGYCGNVHPGETPAALRRQLWHWLDGVRRTRGLERQQSGLWIARDSARQLLADPDLLGDFKADLQATGACLRTLNAFPFEAFHQAEVKQRVYLPDWSQPERFAYTLDCARLLAACLPAGETVATISTLPLGLARTWDPDRHRQALVRLQDLAGGLERLELETGCHVRVCLEMEPGCVLQTTGQLLSWFNDELCARQSATGEDRLRRYLGACLDICHQAVMFDAPGDSLRRLHESGITVGKVQVSNALRLPVPGDPAARRALAAYAEPRYLHQVCTLDADDRRCLQLDLPLALADPSFPRDRPWHVHFHVPVQARVLSEDSLSTTRDAIGEVLDSLASIPALQPHLEVETYTWQLLPEPDRPLDDAGLVRGLAAELDWLQTGLRKRGLLAA